MLTNDQIRSAIKDAAYEIYAFATEERYKHVIAIPLDQIEDRLRSIAGERIDMTEAEKNYLKKVIKDMDSDLHYELYDLYYSSCGDYGVCLMIDFLYSKSGIVEVHMFLEGKKPQLKITLDDLL